MNIQSKQDIVQGLEANFSSLIEWVRNEPDEDFGKGPDGKWTMGQHVVHLISSAKPLNKGLRVPKVVVKSMFGTNNRVERSFSGVVERYKKKLSLGGQASGKYIPKPVPVEKKAALLEELENEGKRLAKAMGKWNEEQLSKFLLPHPLLGKVTIREMMFFTVYHMDHHLTILKRDMALVD